MIRFRIGAKLVRFLVKGAFLFALGFEGVDSPLCVNGSENLPPFAFILVRMGYERNTD